MIESLIVFLPLIASLVTGFGGRWIKARGAQIVTCGAMVIAAALAVLLFVQFSIWGWEGYHLSWLGRHVCGSAPIVCKILYGYQGFFPDSAGWAPYTVPLFTWINVGNFHVTWALHIDTLTTVMMVVVTVVSAMVHLYSVGYMADDPHRPRFMAYLSLFTFMMLMLVTADNLLQMYFGWEGVGLCSYLLINFWYDRPKANTASIKAFLVNRVGDFGFALGIMALFVLFGSVQFADIFAAAPKTVYVSFTIFGYQVPALTAACLLLFMGAMGKSAQLGLHTWLPDAMEGPTPVSALIHAATMVTAGVFMVARLSPVFEWAPGVLDVVTIVGASTAFVAATIGLTQFDIKRIIAYSTMSQLGYMFFAAGVSAYSAAMFHLMTHAFFKALLFLGAGSVIHALGGEQDIRRMGGLWKKIPVTYVLMWIGSLALAGIPFFAGYYSKDVILEAVYAKHSAVALYAFWIGVAAAVMTALYSWRLLILTFHGKTRAEPDVMARVHESPWIMLIPLFVLAIGAVLAGWAMHDWFVGEGRLEFWRGALDFNLDPNGVLHDILEMAHHTPEWVRGLLVGIGFLGLALAYAAYMLWPSLPTRVAQSLGGVYRFIARRWMFDELYDRVFVRPAMGLGRILWRKGDQAVIDGLGPNGLAFVSQKCGQAFSRFQTGYLYHYAFAMVLGLVVLIGWFYW